MQSFKFFAQQYKRDLGRGVYILLEVSPSIYGLHISFFMLKK